MLYSYFTEKLLGLKDVTIKNVKDNEERTEIFLAKLVKPHICPNCGESTAKVHDYRNQRIKDIPASVKQTVLILNKRRYRCKCGKYFYENVEFLPRYRMTNRFLAYVISKLTSVFSYTSVAKETGVSIPTVIRIFDLVQYVKPSLPEILAIDEFKGNTGGEKYQCITKKTQKSSCP